jgi:hypothetical protein
VLVTPLVVNILTVVDTTVQDLGRVFGLTRLRDHCLEEGQAEQLPRCEEYLSFLESPLLVLNWRTEVVVEFSKALEVLVND